MKKVKTKVIAILLLMMVVCCGCGEKYTCQRCEKETTDAYYDPFDKDEYFCADCAREYFAPLPYTNYRVQ